MLYVVCPARPFYLLLHYNNEDKEAETKINVLNWDNEKVPDYTYLIKSNMHKFEKND